MAAPVQLLLGDPTNILAAIIGVAIVRMTQALHLQHVV